MVQMTNGIDMIVIVVKRDVIETYLSGPGLSKHYYDLHKKNLDAKTIQEKTMEMIKL